MRFSCKLRLGAIVALGLTAAVMFASTAGAGQASHGTIHAEGTFDIADFCGEEGMTVELAFVMDIRVQVVPRGKDGLAYFLQHGTRTETLTFDDTSLTSVANVIEKDLTVTDNGDGTVTVLILATGNAVLYDESGRAIARNPGQTRFEIVFGPGDEVLAFEIVKGSTGRSDDFCDAAVSALS